MTDVPGTSQTANSDMTRGLYAGSVSTAQLMKLRHGGSSDDAMRAAAKEFTSLFIGQMMKIMDSTVDRSELTHGGEGEEMFRGMLNDEYARQASYHDRTGLANMVYQSLKQRSAARAVSAQQAMAAGAQKQGSGDTAAAVAQEGGK